MKSRYCPLQELHGKIPTPSNENGYMRSSHFRYSTGGLKSQRRGDLAFKTDDMTRMRLRNKISRRPDRVACASC